MSYHTRTQDCMWRINYINYILDDEMKFCHHSFIDLYIITQHVIRKLTCTVYNFILLTSMLCIRMPIRMSRVNIQWGTRVNEDAEAVAGDFT
ncbi:hypothetical protein ACJX0J_015148, partial [Zea mays]